MGFGIRVTFSPTQRPKVNGGIDVLGATLGFQCLGQQPLPRAVPPVSATLVFFGVYLERVRAVSFPDFERLAALSGELELKGDPPTPVFTVPADADFVYVEPEPAKGKPFRELIFDYSSAHFVEPPQPPAKVTRLRLPTPPDGARFFELGVELQLGGRPESSVSQNERLDVPLRFPFGDQLLWITAPPLDQDFQPELVVFDEAGTEERRIPLPPVCSGPGDCHTIDLSTVRGASARLIELHRGDSPLLPVLRLAVDEIRERLGAGIATGIADVLKPANTGDAGAPLDDGGNALPDTDEDPSLPPLLPPAGAV